VPGPCSLLVKAAESIAAANLVALGTLRPCWRSSTSASLDIVQNDLSVSYVPWKTVDFAANSNRIKSQGSKANQKSEQHTG
jgi:hypothetical protein